MYWKGHCPNSSPLDTARPFTKIETITAVMCDHSRTEIIARRDGVDYLECRECHQIFEAEDLEPVPEIDEEE